MINFHKINREKFIEILEKYSLDYRIANEEVRINSIFADDRKFHLYCNPDKNVYHCWKSGEAGSLIHLIALVGNCSHREAAIELGCTLSIRDLERKVATLRQQPPEQPKPIPALLPPQTLAIGDLPTTSRAYGFVQSYLKNRKLTWKDFYWSYESQYLDRLIIPYRNEQDEVVYYNARDLTNRKYPRYLFPDKGTKTVFLPVKPGRGDLVYVTEGEFDALSIIEAGLLAAGCGGKELGTFFWAKRDGVKICLALDNDESGRMALHKEGQRILRLLGSFSYVVPPSPYKDWNAMLVATDALTVRQFLQQALLPFDPLKLRLTK